MTKLRGAVVGFGKLGLLHAGLINGLPGSTLSAVVESSRLVQRIVDKQFANVDVFSNVDELVRENKPDFAIIATPTGSHIAIAETLVRADIPVLIEKPLALNAREAIPLTVALAENWVPNMVGYMGRYIDTFSKAALLMHQEVLGPVRMIRSSMYIEQLLKPGEGWRYDPNLSGGGVLITQNSHLVDKLLWIFGDIIEVSGNANKLVSQNVEDHVHSYFKFGSGAVGFMDASWSARHFRTPTISIHVQGDNGTLDVNDDEVRLFLDSPILGYAGGWTNWQKPDLYRPVPLDIGGTQYTLQMLEFLNAVTNHTDVQSNVASGLQTQKIIDAIYESSRNGGALVNLASKSK
ncbi:MAG: Gfo/Idh/MocA family oxidoreductase [Proteobacteria bacterium]|nr:Gfo/Idh/MocA family oxidoreductase [Pseudomonadota bacterium]